MTEDEELQDAYNKLSAAEMQIIRLRQELNRQNKIQEVLIAAGFLTREKISEASDILADLDDLGENHDR